MNLTNYSNNNQIYYGQKLYLYPVNYQMQNDLSKTMSDTYSNNSNYSNISNPSYYYNLYNNNNIYDKKKYIIPQKPKKRVTFNETVDVILVESYKKYNREDEDISSSGDYYDYNYNSKKNRKKKSTKCECNII